MSVQREKADVWIPIYVGDYLADTTRLTTAQHGAYFLLILDYWRNGAPPDDSAVLAQITRCSEHDWSIHQAVLKQFFSVEDGKWVHGRIERELELAKNKKSAAITKAKAAADARWNNKEDPSGNAQSNAPSMCQALLEQCPSPSPSPEEKLTDTNVSVVSRLIPNCPAEKLVDLYHQAMPMNPKCMVISDARRGAMRARWRFWAEKRKYSTEAEGLDWWGRLFAFAAKSKFLTGQAKARDGRAPFTADIDFLFAPQSHISLIEGKYHEEAA